jgi:uncharacterized membrane protein YvbJ
MVLNTCRACGKEVAASAKFCRRCGTDSPARSRVEVFLDSAAEAVTQPFRELGMVLLIIIGAVILAVLAAY